MIVYRSLDTAPGRSDSPLARRGTFDHQERSPFGDDEAREEIFGRFAARELDEQRTVGRDEGEGRDRGRETDRGESVSSPGLHVTIDYGRG